MISLKDLKDSKASKSRIAVIVLMCAAIVAAAAGTYFLLSSMLKEYDPTVKHFNYDHFNASAAVCVCVAGAVLAVAGFFAVSKKLTFTPDGKKRCYFVPEFISILTGLMCLLRFVIGVKDGIPKEKPGILLAELTFTVLSAAYFFLRASGLFSKKPVAALSGLLPAFMSAFIMLELYFNTSEPLNAPLKIFESVMLVSFMLYFTAETGVLIARPRMNRKYVFAGILAASSGGMAAVSKAAARIIDPDTFGGDLAKLVFYVVIWLYICVSFAEKVLTLREKTEEEALIDSEYGKKEKEDDKDGKDDKKKDEESYFDIVTALPDGEDSAKSEDEEKEADTATEEKEESSPDEDKKEEPEE